MSSELEQVERELTFMEDRGLQERPKYKQKESEKQKLLEKVTYLEAKINLLYKDNVNIFLQDQDTLTNLDDILQVITLETKEILNACNVTSAPIQKNPSLNRRVTKPQESNLTSKSIEGEIIETHDVFQMTQQGFAGSHQEVARKQRERVFSQLTGHNKSDKFRAIRHISFLYLQTLYQQEFVKSKLFDELKSDLESSIIEIRLLKEAEIITRDTFQG